MPLEIELDDGTVLEVPEGMTPDQAEADYHREVRIATLKAKQPEEFDPESPEYRRKHSAAEQEKTPTGIADPKTGLDLSRLPVDQRARFFKQATTVGPDGKMLSKYTPEEQANFWAKIDQSVSPKHNLENTLAGVGSGLIRTGKGLTNLVLPDSITPEWASDENIQEMDRRDQDLPGDAKMVGSMVGSLPLSAGIGSGLRLATGAAGAGTKLASVAASPLTRTLTEGAVQGAVYADPDEQGTGALMGAAIGGGLHGLGAAGGRMLRGAVNKSEEAKALQQLAEQHGEDLFVPISQAADEKTLMGRLTKSFFKEALPIVPGVKGKLTRQAEEAADKMRELAVKEGLPEGVPVAGDVGKRPLESMDYIKQEFDKAYDDTVKSYAFNVPKDLSKQVKAGFQAKAGPKTTVNNESLDTVSAEVQKIVDKYSNKSGVLDGTNILNAKRDISDLISSAKGQEKLGYMAADELLDNIIVTEMKQGGKPSNLADLQKYLELTPAYRAFVPVRRAAQNARATEGRFKFSQLADASAKSPEQQVLGQLGHAVLDKAPASGGLIGKILAGVGLGGSGYGAFMAPTETLTAVLGGNALASKPVQRLLLGDTKMQKFLVDALRKHPELKRRLGSAARSGVVSSTTRGDGDE